MKAGRMLTCVVALASCAWAVAVDRPGVVTPSGDVRFSFDDAAAGGGIGLRGVGPGLGAGADHIIAQQCPDGGWGWPHASCSTTYNNITGPIALGLLEAYSNTSDPDHLAAAVAGGYFDLTYQYPNGESRFGAFAANFLWQLSLASGDGQYGNHAQTEFFDKLTAGTYGPSDLDTFGWIASVEAGRTGTWVNLRPWEFHNLIATATAIGNATSGIDTTTNGTDEDSDGNDGEDAGTQEDLFLNGLLRGLNTLDNTDPDNVYSDLIGLAGGVRGLALSGTLNFAAINSPNHAAIDTIDNLCELAAALLSFRNTDGSWSWHSAYQNSADPSDPDTQTTAYALMALVAAQDAGCGPYAVEISEGRDWLRSIQLPDGGFPSYVGGDENTEVEGEALNALAPDTCSTDVLEFRLAAGSDCVQPGETVTVELWQRDLDQLVRGFQAFAQFDSSMMNTNGPFAFTSSPYGLEILNTMSGDDINLAAGIDNLNGQTPTDADALLVTLVFTAGATEGPTTVSFRSFAPPTRFTDEIGEAVPPCLIESPAICIDGTPPEIDCTGMNITTNNDSGACDAIVDPGVPTATDEGCGVASIVGVRSDGLALTDPYPAGCAPGTTTTIVWTATDCAGNTATCEQTITVIDDTPPTIDACPIDINTNNDVGTCGAVVTWTEPTADDNCAIDTFVSNYSPGDFFAVGTTHVVYTATDICGNVTTCGFDVTVTDAEDPEFVDCPAGINTNSDVGTCGAIVIWNDSAGDNCDDNVDVICSPASGSFFEVGTTLVTCIATDDVGNTTTCGFDVTITDAEDPMIHDCPDDITTNADANTCGAVITWTEPTADDNCAIDTFVSNYSPGDFFPTGTTRITYTATDIHGNVSTCGFYVTITDYNELVVSVELRDVVEPTLDRCITFELWECGTPSNVSVEQVLTFTNGLATNVTVLVPCGSYTCITARDRLHTLRSTDDDDFEIPLGATYYAADFTGDDALIGGNLNDDSWISILDFGIFSWQWNSVYSIPGDTTCNTAGPHADVSGNGVVFTEDFTFIHTNFLLSRQPNCCGDPSMLGEGDGPITEISVRELHRLGLGHLEVADLNGDQRLDQDDIVAFMQGARPRRRPQPRPELTPQMREVQRQEDVVPATTPRHRESTVESRDPGIAR